VSESQTQIAENAPVEILKMDPERYTAAVFQPFRAQLDAIKAEGAAVTFEIQTTAGMSIAVAWRRKFRELRVEAEKARKERKAPILEIGRLLDAKAKDLEAEILPLEDRFDVAIKAEEARREEERKAEEARERARVEQIQNRIAELRGALGAVAYGAASGLIAEHIADLVKVPVEMSEFAEFTGHAQVAKDETLAKLREQLAATIAREEQAEKEKLVREAEEARLKAEREQLERDRAAHAEEERQAAAARAKVDAEARAKREAEEAELRRQREELAKQQAEVDRQRREQEARDEAARQAEARKHREAENIAKAQAAAERDRQTQIRAQRRPSDDQIVEALCKAFRSLKPTEDEVIEWVATFDAEDARSRRLVAAA
jgi:hypothetical protein